MNPMCQAVDGVQVSLQSWPPTVPLTLKALATAPAKSRNRFPLPVNLCHRHDSRQPTEHDIRDHVPVQGGALKKSGSFYFCFFGEAIHQVKKLGLDQGSAKSGPLPVFINKALLEHSHAY